jgi:hypothetical protein
MTSELEPRQPGRDFITAIIPARKQSHDQDEQTDILVASGAPPDSYKNH